jgi:hypothetical protein
MRHSPIHPLAGVSVINIHQSYNPSIDTKTKSSRHITSRYRGLRRRPTAVAPSGTQHVRFQHTHPPPEHHHLFDLVRLPPQLHHLQRHRRREQRHQLPDERGLRRPRPRPRAFVHRQTRELDLARLPGRQWPVIVRDDAARKLQHLHPSVFSLQWDRVLHRLQPADPRHEQYLGRRRPRGLCASGESGRRSGRDDEFVQSSGGFAAPGAGKRRCEFVWDGEREWSSWCWCRACCAAV